MSEEKLIKIGELSEVTGLPNQVLWRQARTNQIPSYRIGRRYLFKLSEVLDATKNKGSENEK